MPEALATTKRKFYKALDAITSGSQTSLALTDHSIPTSDKTAVTQAKSSAEAYDEARERVRKRLRPSTSSISLSVRDDPIRAAPSDRLYRLASATAKAKDLSTKQSPPNFSPWSQDRFLTRLKTFSSVSQWHPKPDLINEVKWAKRGWTCVDVNTVACKGGCGQRVLVKLDFEPQEPPSEGQNQEDQEDQEEHDTVAIALEMALAKKYESVIVDGHAESCLWYKAGCKEDIYRLQVIRPGIWQPELRKRYRSVADIHEIVQNVAFRRLQLEPGILPMNNLLQALPQGILDVDVSSTQISEPSFVVAMHGWRASSESGNRLLHCDACFQRIGLWMYQPGHRIVSVDVGGDDLNDDSSVVDLVDMHRDHCPWRNAKSQSAAGSFSGLNACQILQRVASTCARDHRRRTCEKSELSDSLQGPPSNDATPESHVPSREENLRKDKERESRLRKLKNLFSIKRRTIKSSSKTIA